MIGHLDQPLLMPTEEEREGYVPNVVYTCGALIHDKHLYLPYAMSASATGRPCNETSSVDIKAVPLNSMVSRSSLNPAKLFSRSGLMPKIGPGSTFTGPPVPVKG